MKTFPIIFIISTFVCLISSTSCVENDYIEYGPEKLSRVIDNKGGTIHFYDADKGISETILILDFPSKAIDDKTIIDRYQPFFRLDDYSYAVNEKYIAITAHYFSPNNLQINKPINCKLFYQQEIYKSTDFYGENYIDLFEGIDTNYLENKLKIYELINYTQDNNAKDTLRWLRLPESKINMEEQSASFIISNFNSGYFLAFPIPKCNSTFMYDFNIWRINNNSQISSIDFSDSIHISNFEFVTSLSNPYTYMENNETYGGFVKQHKETNIIQVTNDDINISIRFKGDVPGKYICDNTTNYVGINKHLLWDNNQWDLYWNSITNETTIEITEYSDTVGGQIKGKIYGNFRMDLGWTLDLNSFEFNVTRGIHNTYE